MDINSVVVAGRLTRDPELKALPSGSHVCQLSIATSRTFLKDGKKEEETEYSNVVVFGKTAESAAKYLVKGQYASVIGRLKTRTWDKDGQKQYRTEIISERLQFGPKSGGPSAATPTSSVPDYPDDEINPDDIPF